MRLLAAVLAALTIPASAPAAFAPGDPPQICTHGFTGEQVGTPGDDQLASSGPAERLYGLAGFDRLFGSRTRASCLFGGPDDDMLVLNAGGGIAWGEEGSDVLFGSDLGDILDGGEGIDGFLTGGGPDQIASRDGFAEIIHCGHGEDSVAADRRDLTIACEQVASRGARPKRLRATPRRTDIGGVVRTQFRARADALYRVLYVTPAAGRTCTDGPVELMTFAARAGDVIGLRIARPERGWCEGAATVAIVRDYDGLPFEPVARFSFQVL